jgi:hypothetical protein
MGRDASKAATRTVTARQGTGSVKVSILRKRVPRLPHERDESADSQGSEPRPVMRQASADLKRGLEDTDRGREMNRLHLRFRSSR